MTRPIAAPRREARRGERMKHTSFRLDSSLIARIEAVKPMFSGRYREPPRAQMIRILLDHALTSFERRQARRGRG